MIIWGFRSRNKVYGQVQFVCSRCHQHSYHSIVRTQRWFTLFFIPLFPFRTSYTSRCNMCGIELRIDKERVETLFAPQQQQQQIPAQPIQPAPPLQPQATDYPPQPAYYEQNRPPQQ